MTPRIAAALALLLPFLASCGAHQSGPAPGCGWVAAANVTALVGDEVRTRTTGKLTELHDANDPSPVACRTTSTKDAKRYVAIRVERHPDPLPIPRRGCNAGWVFAGTPDAYAPACQETTDNGSRTVLLVREADDYIVRITIGRPDRKWAGDPEVALAMGDEIGARLG